MEPDPIHELYQAIKDRVIIGASIDYSDPGSKFSGTVVDVKVEDVLYVILKAVTDGDSEREVTFAKNITMEVKRIDDSYGKGWSFTTSESQELRIRKPHQ